MLHVSVSDNMNIKESFLAISEVARSTYHDDATLVYNGNTLSIEHKGSVCHSNRSLGPISFYINNDLNLDSFKPIAKLVYDDFIFELKLQFECGDSDCNDKCECGNLPEEQTKGSKLWAQKILGSLL